MINFYCRCCDKGFFSLRAARNHVRKNPAIDWGGKRKKTALYIRTYKLLSKNNLYSCKCCSMVWELEELVKGSCPITLLPVEVYNT